jgi:hypothetical protein
VDAGDLTPAPGERHLLVRRDVLVAEEDHAVIQERPVHGSERVIVNV